MLQIDEQGIIVAVHPFSEKDAVVRVMTRAHGVVAGMVKAGMTSKQRGLMQVGNYVSLSWKARLAEQLGTMKLELLHPVAAQVMSMGDRLAACTSACALTERYFAEREAHKAAFDALEELLHWLVQPDECWRAAYVRFEATLLTETGFGLDLSRCAGTGTRENLAYISPKSGCAVSEQAGAPYASKLFLLPNVLKNTEKTALSPAQTIDALRMTGYFMETRLVAASGRDLPAARARLMRTMERSVAA